MVSRAPGAAQTPKSKISDPLKTNPTLPSPDTCRAPIGGRGSEHISVTKTALGPSIRQPYVNGPGNLRAIMNTIRSSGSTSLAIPGPEMVDFCV